MIHMFDMRFFQGTIKTGISQFIGVVSFRDLSTAQTWEVESWVLIPDKTRRFRINPKYLRSWLTFFGKLLCSLFVFLKLVLGVKYQKEQFYKLRTS